MCLFLNTQQHNNKTNLSGLINKQTNIHNMNALVLGATGLCGNFMLKYSIAAKEVNKVFTITRSPLQGHQDEDPKVTSYQDKDNAKWGGIIKNDIKDNIDILLTGLATTRTVAGNDFQYTIDHDLNIELAKAAKDKGCKTLVVVSTMGANKDSHFFYPRMKGEIERDLIALGFDKTIVLRPGILLGERVKEHHGAGNGTATTLGNWFYRSRCQWLLGYPVKGEEVAKVGVYLALKDTKEKIQIVGSSEILKIASKL
ncbi:hypothetical protein MOUN0_F06260 [Monosporozyma unispora]